MATKKKPPAPKAGKTTVSGPARKPGPNADAPARKADATQKLASAFPFNADKPGEIGAQGPQAKPGTHAAPADPSVGASTLTESAMSDKTGSHAAPGINATNVPLALARVDSTGRVLTTNFGQPVPDNQTSLKAGLRGPTLMEDFILREKITHFDHERIPERIVHARGSAAHGVFQCRSEEHTSELQSQSNLVCRLLLEKKKKKKKNMKSIIKD